MVRGQGGVGDLSAELARLLMGLTSPLLSGAAAPGLANSGVIDKKAAVPPPCAFLSLSLQTRIYLRDLHSSTAPTSCRPASVQVPAIEPGVHAVKFGHTTYYDF